MNTLTERPDRDENAGPVVGHGCSEVGFMNWAAESVELAMSMSGADRGEILERTAAALRRLGREVATTRGVRDQPWVY